MNELFASIYTHDTIYLPPSEQGLRGLGGCPWMQPREMPVLRLCKGPVPDSFHGTDPAEHADPGPFPPGCVPALLLGENAFVLDYQKLCQIFDMTDQYMPNIHEFSMYSRIDDIARKTDEELRMLHKMGLSTLHIGLGKRK